MQATMDEQVETFNATLGREKGIILSVTSISGSVLLQEKLKMIANNDPGAPEMPDLTTCYPATAVVLANREFAADSLFNLFQGGLAQLGSSLFNQTDLCLDTPEFRRIFDLLLEAAVKGGFALYDGYFSDLAKTGDIVCSLGSAAEVLFYGDEIAYADNTKEEAE